MNGLVVLAACVCASSAQFVGIAPARAIAPVQQSHQFHAQDEFGQFTFGHAGGPSARTESRDAFGVTQGSYQYVDANGILQTVNYIADPVNGFRVAGTNLPAAPVAPAAPVVAPLEAPVFDLTGPAPVVDTPEVVAAKAEFQAAFDAAVAAAGAERKRRSVPALLPAATAALPAYPYAAGVYAAHPSQIVANIAPATPAVAAPAIAAPAIAAPAIAAPAPLAPALAYNAVSAPAAREAVLTTIKLNPGHAVAYRVD